MQPVVVGADQNEVSQLGGAAVLPVADVVGMQTAGGPAPGHHTAAVAVLEGAAQPAVDHPRRAAGTDDFTAAFEPDLASGIAGQVLAFGVGEQRAQMQRSDPFLDVQMHHHRGLLPVRPAQALSVSVESVVESLKPTV